MMARARWSGPTNKPRGKSNVLDRFCPRNRHHLRRRFPFRASARFGRHFATDRLKLLQSKETEMNGRFLINRGDGKVMGVAAGLADYTGVDPTIVRLGIIALTLLTGPVMIFFYVVTGLLAPHQ
jgi:phage shock protein C